MVDLAKQCGKKCSAIKTGKEQFSPILFVETHPGVKDHEAIILTGPAAEHRINDLMAVAEPKKFNK
jgi:hypothetical protein